MDSRNWKLLGCLKFQFRINDEECSIKWRTSDISQVAHVCVMLLRHFKKMMWRMRHLEYCATTI